MARKAAFQTTDTPEPAGAPLETDAPALPPLNGSTLWEDTPADEPPAAPQFSPADAKTLYLVLAELEIMVAQRAFKIPAQIARQVFTYGPDDLDQLGEPTAALLNKYMPAAIGARKDELALAFALLAVHQRKFFQLQMLVAQQAQQAAAAPPAAPAPAEGEPEFTDSAEAFAEL